MRTAAEMNKDVRGLAPETVAMLQRYEWPGNVRELQHAIERAVILSSEPILQPGAFDDERFGLAPGGAGPSPQRSLKPDASCADASASVPPGAVVLTSLDVGEAEAQLIARALEVSGGNRTRAAALLGISVRTLRNKLNGQGPTSA